MEYGMEVFGMKWKKITSMEYKKIVFHSIPCPAYEHLLKAKWKKLARGNTQTGARRSSAPPESFYLGLSTIFQRGRHESKF